MKKPGYFVYKEFLVHGKGQPAHPVLYRTQWPSRWVYYRNQLAEKLAHWEFGHRKMEFDEKTWSFKRQPWDVVYSVLWKLLGRPFSDHEHPQIRLDLTREQASIEWSSYEGLDELDAKNSGS